MFDWYRKEQAQYAALRSAVERLEKNGWGHKLTIWEGIAQAMQRLNVVMCSMIENAHRELFGFLAED